MKKSVFFSSLLLSSIAFADVDYSRCLMASGMYGASIDNDGKFQPGQFNKFKSVKTEGNKETYIFENSGAFGFYGGTRELQLERDEQGRVIRASTGGDKMDPKNLKQYKETMVQFSVSGLGGGYMGGYMGGGQDFITSEPQFYVDGKVVPLSKLTKAQAKEAGFEGNIENLQKLKSQWRKDKKVVEKIKSGYEKILDKTSLSIPMGSEAEFEIKDGVCLVKNVASKTYNTKTKEVVKTPGVSRETCEKIQNIHKKYETKMNECHDLSMKISREYYDNNAFAQGGMPGYGYGGIVGGYGIGMGGGYVGGYAGGIGGGAGTFQCEMLYGVGPVQGGLVGGFNGGATGGAVAPAAKEQ